MPTSSALLDWLDQQLAALNVEGPLRRTAIAILVLCVGLLLAKLTERAANAVGERLARLVGGVAQGARASVAQDSWVKRTPGRIAYWLVVVLTVLGVSEVLQLPFVGAWLERWGAYLPRALAAVAIVAIGSAGARVARHLVSGAATSAGVAGAARLGRVARVLVLFGTWLLAVEQLGLEITFLKDLLLVAVAALMGSAALAFGLGGGRVVTQVLEAHFVHKLYRVGQRVEIDGVEGHVVRITPLAILVDDGEAQVAIPTRELARNRFRILTGTEPP